MSSTNKFTILSKLSMTFVLLALILFFSWQLSLTRELKANLAEANEQRLLLIEQANDAQTKTSAQLEAFLNDLLQLAESDPQAAALVKRYNIRRNAPATTASEAGEESSAGE